MGKRSGPRPLRYTGLQHSKGSMVRVPQQPWMLLAERPDRRDGGNLWTRATDLDGIVETYTECIRQACETAIPPRNSKRRLKPGGVPELRFEATRTKSGASETRPQQTGDGESLWDGIYRVIRETGNREDVHFKTDSGLVLSPNESAPSWRKPSSHDRSILTIRTRKSEGEPTGMIVHPQLLGICPGGPPLPGLRLGLLLKHSTLEKPLALMVHVGHMPGCHLPGPGIVPSDGKISALSWDTFPGLEGGNLIIPKPGKDDYARPKSYRPIGLPCWAKQERMLVGRSNGI
ncbi:hypothetical protein EVAR_90929_1 [Eumeta japonica]|uniref:Uncharacterized protein n=1 Tax=Eumeta variegata TaxID=151549 RepID=A0A4C2AAX8_EUMVA|nr:hypothetical protein EVAR_90929_1 [Eumeta japonica]